MKKCNHCGTELACPKCAPAFNYSADTITVRHKDKNNVGLPNMLILAPCFSYMVAEMRQDISVAVLIGDNFEGGYHVFTAYCSVEALAALIARADINYLIDHFKLGKWQIEPFLGLVTELQKWVKDNG